MRKRVVCIVLTVVMLFGLFPVLPDSEQLPWLDGLIKPLTARAGPNDPPAAPVRPDGARVQSDGRTHYVTGRQYIEGLGYVNIMGSQPVGDGSVSVSANGVVYGAVHISCGRYLHILCIHVSFP